MLADIITQAELRAVWSMWNNFGNTILNIRHRLENGIAIEPGYLSATSAGPSNPIEDQLNDGGLLMEPRGLDMFGLDITLGGDEDEPAAAVVQEQQEPGPSEPALPEWLTSTPLETEYWLTMHEGGLGAEECQRVRLDRNEYLHLKVFLAKMRSIPVPLDRPEGVKVGGTEYSLWDELESEEIAAVPEATHAN